MIYVAIVKQAVELFFLLLLKYISGNMDNSFRMINCLLNFIVFKILSNIPLKDSLLAKVRFKTFSIIIILKERKLSMKYNFIVHLSSQQLQYLPGMDPASNFWGGAAEIYFHSRRSISVALSKYVSAVFGILISIHVVNTDVFV